VNCTLTGGASFARTVVTVAPGVAPPVGLLRVTETVSSDSVAVSLTIGVGVVFDDASLLVHLRVPLVVV
jgi:hypothetical protein